MILSVFEQHKSSCCQLKARNRARRGLLSLRKIKCRVHKKEKVAWMDSYPTRLIWGWLRRPLSLSRLSLEKLHSSRLEL